MIIQIYERLKSLGFDDFGTLYIGYMGIPEYGCLTNTDVVNYVSEFLEKDQSLDIKINDVLVELLLIERQKPRNEVTILLEKIVQILEINLSKSVRKWLLVCLSFLLANLNSDPVYGLLELSNFWIEWGQPDDSPHCIQGVSNEISAVNYYTAENYELIIQKNWNWLNQEIEKYKRT